MAKRTTQGTPANPDEEAFFEGDVIGKVSLLMFATTVIAVFCDGVLWAISNWGWFWGLTAGSLLSAIPAFGLFMLGLDSPAFRKFIAGLVAGAIGLLVVLHVLFPPS